jgi:hypothetical protein
VREGRAAGLARGYIPDLNLTQLFQLLAAIARSSNDVPRDPCRENLTVRAEGHRPDRAMLRQRHPEGIPGGHVPEADLPLRLRTAVGFHRAAGSRPRHDDLPIGAKGSDNPSTVSMRQRCAGGLASGHIAQACGGVVVDSQNCPSVRAHGGERP